MFFEELINENNTSEENISLIEQSDIITEQLDFIVDILNESYFDDLMITKKDLLDPNKVKAIVRKIEKEDGSKDKKLTALNALYGLLIGMVGIAPGATISALGIAINSVIVLCLGELIILVGGALTMVFSLDRVQNLINKTRRAIKRVEKKIKKEDDPYLKKAYNEQLKALEKTLKTFQNMDYKIKEDRLLRMR